MKSIESSQGKIYLVPGLIATNDKDDYSKSFYIKCQQSIQQTVPITTGVNNDKKESK